MVLIALFTIFFGPQLSLFVGLAVGYMQVYGLFKRIELGAATATRYESSFLFKRFNTTPAFITAGASMGGTILP